jgi:hypothetical protein
LRAGRAGGDDGFDYRSERRQLPADLGEDRVVRKHP